MKGCDWCLMKIHLLWRTSTLASKNLINSFSCLVWYALCMCVCVCACMHAHAHLAHLCLNPCWCAHYVLSFAKLQITFSILMYIMCVMFVQHFELQGRCFTNFFSFFVLFCGAPVRLCLGHSTCVGPLRITCVGHSAQSAQILHVHSTYHEMLHRSGSVFSKPWSSRPGKLASCMAGPITSSCTHMPHQVSRGHAASTLTPSMLQPVKCPGWKVLTYPCR